MQYAELSLNGNTLRAQDLLTYCKESGSLGISPELIDFLTQWLSAEDSIEQQTSGSTGEPKTIRLLKDSMVLSAKLTAKALGIEAGQTAMLCLPAGYIGGRMMVVRSMVLGLNLHTTEPKADLDPTKFKKQYDLVAMTPMQLSRLLDKSPAAVEKCKTLLIGGAPVSPFLKSNLSDLTNNIFSTYGMTETCSHIALRRLNGSHSSDIYKCLEGVKVSADSDGRAIIEAPHVQAEHLKTNDLIEVIDEQSFKWKGRSDYIINSGGVKLIPEEIEEKLAGKLNNPYFIGSRPHDELGEILTLFIEGEEHIISDEIFSDLAKFERPRSIEFIQQFERTATGKIRRKLSNQ